MYRKKAKTDKPYGMFVLCASTVDNIIKLDGTFPIEGGITVTASDSQLEPGGEGNLIICFNRMGGKALPVGAVGTDDVYSDFMINAYTELGVETSCLKRIDGYRLPVANCIVDAEGRHTFLSYMPGVDFDSDENIMSKLELCQAYYMSGYYLAKGHHFYDLALKIMHKANEYGIPVFFDPGPCLENASEELKKELLEHVDVFCMNEVEGKALTGIADPEKAAEYLKERTEALILMKYGARGCYVTAQGLAGKWYPGFKVRMVDTMGCGDSFLSTFMYGYLEGFDLDTCIILGNAAGAVKAAKFGTGRNVPTFDEVVTMLENNGYTVNETSKQTGRFTDLELK